MTHKDSHLWQRLALDREDNDVSEVVELGAIDSVDELDVAGMEYRVAHDRTRAENDIRTIATVGIIVLAENLVFAEHVELVRDT